MTKWLRKYSKVLLVVAGVLLMVGFLIGPAISQFGPNPAKRTVGYIGPDKRAVSALDIGNAGAELAAMRRFLAPLSRGAQGELLLGYLDIRNEVHWLLLVQEARRAGFVASQGDGAAWINDLANQAAFVYAREQFIQEFDAQNPGLGNFLRQNPQFLAQVNPDRQQQLVAEWAGPTGRAYSMLQQERSQTAAEFSMTLEQFDQTLTKLRGISRMVSSSLEAPSTYSDRRAAALARLLGDAATVDYVWIPGTRLAASVGEPTPEQLQSHFQQYRQTMPGTGEFGLGYLQPPRARLAWLTLDRAAITQAVQQAEIPADQLLERWSRQRLVYTGEFTAEMDRVRADMQAARVSEILDLARRAVVQEVHRSTQDLARAGGAYFQVTDDYVRPDLEAIAQRVVAEVQATANVAIPLPPVTILNGDWQNRTDLASLPGIGQSRMRQGASTVSFPDAVLSVRELAGENPLGMQVGVPHVEQPLEDSAGNLYFLMVLDVRPTGAADSIDEVIDEVRHDYIALKGYELLLAQLDTLRQTAVASGLEAVAAQFPPEQALAEGDQPPAPLEVVRDQSTRSEPTAQAFPLADRGFAASVLETARGLDPRVPAPEQPAEARTLAQGVPAGLGVSVAQVVWFTPFTRELYRGFASSETEMAGATFREMRDALIPADAPVDEAALFAVAMGAFADEPMRERWQWVEKDD